MHSTFLSYPTALDSKLSAARTLKTLAELKAIPPIYQSLEYRLLSQAFVPPSCFNLDNDLMDRYSNVKAYEHSRVKLPEIGTNYYLNANVINSIVDEQAFSICGQAPLAPFDSFWQTVYYKDVRLIIMLCKFVDPIRGIQAQPYWPSKGYGVMMSGGIEVSCIDSVAHDEEFLVSSLLLDGPYGAREVQHLHWMGWPDMKKPNDQKLKRMEEIIQVCLGYIRNQHMVYIHCSAGIGRTGTLVSLLESVRLFQATGKLSIFRVVETLRHFRHNCVQTEQQYRFLYSFLMKLLQE